MRTFIYVTTLGLVLCTLALVVRSGMFMRQNPGEPINAAMRQALAGIAYQWPPEDAARLAQNYAGAYETPNGARYVIRKPGIGNESPETGSLVSVVYTARFFANGEKIDASEDHGGPYNFVVGQANILPGWGDALHQIRVGEHRSIVLPYWLAYGEKGQRGKIPAKAAIQLDLELLTMKAAQP